MADPAVVVADTRRWLERAVVGLNLCPFAKAVLVKEQVHITTSQSEDPVGILDALGAELDALLARSAEERDTTLLVLPRAPEDFLSFLPIVQKAERLLRKRGVEGVVQVVPFHPRFVFAQAEEDDVTNSTNRAPYPTLQLLREESLDRAVAAIPDPAAIYEANMETLRQLGPEGWNALGVGPSA